MADYTNGVYFPAIAQEDLTRSEYLGPAPRIISASLGLLESHFPEDDTIGLDSATPDGIGFFYPNYENPSDSVTIATGQFFPRESEADRRQVMLESASGKVSVYDAGYADGVFSVVLRQMSEAKRVRLYCFLVNICKKSMHTFDFVERFADDAGTYEMLRYTVRLVGKFSPSMRYWAKNDIVLTLRKEQE